MDERMKARVQRFEDRMEAMFELLGMACHKSLGSIDMTSVHDGLREMLSDRSESKIVQSGVWLFVNVGLDAKGDMQGELAMGGERTPLIVLKQYVSAMVDAELAKNGSCGCPRCSLEAIEELAQGEEIPDGQVH